METKVETEKKADMTETWIGNTFGSQEKLEKAIEYARETGVPTGSYYFGYEEAEDIDFVVNVNDFDKYCKDNLKVHINPVKYFEEDGFLFMSIKVLSSNYDKPVNIILVENKEVLEMWKETTRIFKEAIFHPSVKKVFADKANRVTLFTTIRRHIWKTLKTEKLKTEEKIEEIPF